MRTLPTLRWRTHAQLYYGRTNPVISGGHVLVGEPQRLASYDAETGALRWELATTENLLDAAFGEGVGSKTCYRGSSPTVCGGAIYTGTCMGALFLLRLADGKVMGRHRVGAPVTGAPIVDEQGVTVFPASIQVEREYRRANIGRLGGPLALDRSLSRVLRRHRRMVWIGQWESTPQVPWVGDYYALVGPDGLSMVHRASGAILWNLPRVDGRVAATDDALYLCSAQGVAKLDPRSGAEIWRTKVPCDRMVVAGDLVVAHTAAQTRLEALRSKDGSSQWMIPNAYVDQYSDLTAAGTVLYYGRGGAVVARDLSTGAALWRFDARKGAVYSAVVPHGSSLYFSTQGWLIRIGSI